MIDLSQVSTQSPFLSSVKFLPSTSNDLTKEQWREETGEGMKERSREKSVTSLIKSIRRLTLKPLLLNRAEKLKSLWWSRLFPGFVFVSFFFIFLWFKSSLLLRDRAYMSRLRRVGSAFAMHDFSYLRRIQLATKTRYQIFCRIESTMKLI